MQNNKWLRIKRIEIEKIILTTKQYKKTGVSKRKSCFYSKKKFAEAAHEPSSDYALAC